MRRRNGESLDDWRARSAAARRRQRAAKARATVRVPPAPPIPALDGDDDVRAAQARVGRVFRLAVLLAERALEAALRDGAALSPPQAVSMLVPWLRAGYGPDPGGAAARETVNPWAEAEAEARAYAAPPPAPAPGAAPGATSPPAP